MKKSGKFFPRPFFFLSDLKKFKSPEFEKKIYIFLFLIFGFTGGKAQTWTWMKGDQLSFAFPKYGLKGVSSNVNNPSGRSGSMIWQDATGNIWMFGGDAQSTLGSGQLNDLWKYSPSNNNWTWMGGDTVIDQKGVYGTKGVSSPLNHPGSRTGAVTWIDSSGDLWMFGGWGYADSSVTWVNNVGYLNDLWKYEISSGEWTWMGGSTLINNKGDYGFLQTPGVNNVPPSRSGATCWQDKNGDVWLFGGQGDTALLTYILIWYNDLWKYNIQSGTWTWMKGQQYTSANGTYGTIMVPSSSNEPGSRSYACGGLNSSGELILFAGEGFDDSLTSFLPGVLSDMWKYTISTNEWTWINGSNVMGEYANFGVKGVPSTSVHPAAKAASTCWSDSKGQFWVFGGAASSPTVLLPNRIDDLWRYNPSTNEWTWMKGRNIHFQPPIFGQQGVPNNANEVGALGMSAGWVDSNDNLWMVAGDMYNNVWRFTNCNSPSISISSTDSLICAMSTATVTASGANTFTWSTGVIGLNTVVQPLSSTSVIAIGSTSTGCPVGANLLIKVMPAPVISIAASDSSLCKDEFFTLKALGVGSFSWSTGASTDSILIKASLPQVYSVSCVNSFGCMNTSSVFITVSACQNIDKADSDTQTEVYPNPTSGEIIISIPGKGKLRFLLFELSGTIVKQMFVEALYPFLVDVPPGLYMYEVYDDNGLVRRDKLLRQ